MKIFEDAYTDSWAVDRLILAHGQHSVIVPNLPAGDYLFRGKYAAYSQISPMYNLRSILFVAEIAALHEADSLYSQNPIRGVVSEFYDDYDFKSRPVLLQQMYISCAQITVTSPGNETLPTGVPFPGAYNDTTPGIQFNIYKLPGTQYVPPGPAVWADSEGGSVALVGLVDPGDSD